MSIDDFSQCELKDLQQVDTIGVRFEQAMLQGKNPSIEDELRQVAESLRRLLFRELLKSEIEFQLKRQQQPDIAGYNNRFPEYLQIVSAVAEAMSEFAADTSRLSAYSQDTHRPADQSFRRQSSGPYRSSPSFESIDGFTIEGTLGRGGMGIVYRARDRKLKRSVAVKLLRPELAANVSARERFLREARASAAIRHPAIVTIYEVEEQHDPPYLVLELVEGRSLSDVIQESRTIDLPEILRIARDVATGLAAAHGQGVIHRDIKPANILIEALDGRVRLADFGLARVLSDCASVTSTGEVLGTPRYMSPEQCEGRELDARSDLFSFGVVLYQLVTGRLPFTGDSPAAVVRQICDKSPVPVAAQKPETPRWLGSLIMKLLEKNPDRRIQSAKELLHCLAEESDATPGLSGDRARSMLRPAPVAAVIAVIWAGYLLSGAMTPVSPTDDIGVTESAGVPVKTAPRDEASNPVLSDTGTGLVPAAVESDLPLLIDSGLRLGTSAANAAAIADMDNDGDLDIVVGNGKFRLPQPDQLWLNDGRGNFTQSSAPFGTRICGDVALGDVNSDGLVDVYFANWSDTETKWGTNSLWLNDGKGQFSRTNQAPDTGSSRAAFMTDVDGDLDVDIWNSNYDRSDSLWINDGAGRFSAADLQTPGMLGGRAILRDIDQDGLPDAVIQRTDLELWMNQGGTRFERSHVLYDGRIVFFDLCDVNSDRLPDIVTQRSQGLQIRMNRGALRFEEQKMFGTPGRYNPMAVGDMNSDGHPDIVSACHEADGCRIYLNDGSGRFTLQQDSIPVRYTSDICLADLDNDGDLDVFFANSNNAHTGEPDQVWWNTTVHRSTQQAPGSGSP